MIVRMNVLRYLINQHDKKKEQKREKKEKEEKEDTHKFLSWKKWLSFFVIFVFRPFFASPQVGIAVVATDPNKRLPQCHIILSALDPGNILKQIVDVAINGLIASNRAATVFHDRETLAFEKCYIATMNKDGKSLCLVSINVDRLFIRVK